MPKTFSLFKKKMSFPCWIELNMLSSMWKLLIICLHLVLGYVLSMVLLVIVSFFNRIAQLVNNANVFEDSKMVMIVILLNFNYNKEKCFSILSLHITELISTYCYYINPHFKPISITHGLHFVLDIKKKKSYLSDT